MSPNSHTYLDRIVMKCQEKDRQRRYETANGLPDPNHSDDEDSFPTSVNASSARIR